MRGESLDRVWSRPSGKNTIEIEEGGMAGSVCLVTVHGIGFQRAANDADDVAGYADQLHTHLRERLGTELGDDPRRSRPGPVYVSSEWERSPAKGLARLDPGAPLAQPGKIAHVALVYSPSEHLAPHPAETAEALARAAVSHHQYASAIGILRLLLSDAWAALHENDQGSETSTLVPRGDLRHLGLLSHLLHRGDRAPGGGATPPPGALGMLAALEDDIATYIARNELRERVRGFVEDALLALLNRDDDVSAIVVNTHSQGTVLCWDVLCRLPFSTWVRDQDARAARVPHFVTAGSPIRKYVRMFAWGNQVGELSSVLPSGPMAWSNFCDPHDPVADPLSPAQDWRPGQPWQPATSPDDALLVARNFEDGSLAQVPISDIAVDNIRHSAGGGLQAHDYWNNTSEFVPRLAEILSTPMTGGAS
jgi:hypothetical protein